jgi:dynein intermediate chain
MCPAATCAHPLQNLAAPAAAGGTAGPVSTHTVTPLRSFERAGGYVAEAQWSPAHPAVFATADAAGTMQLWNLNRDTRKPAYSFSPGAVEEAAAATSPALSRLRWALDGRRVAAGDVAGNTLVMEAHSDFFTPSADDITAFDGLVARWQQAQAGGRPGGERVAGGASGL